MKVFLTVTLFSQQSNSVNYNRSLSLASNAALQQSSSAAALQAGTGFNKLKASGFNMGSMDALDALQMGSTEQLALPDVENDFDLQNALSAQQDQLSSSPLTSGSASNGNPKELKFEQKKVTSSSKRKVRSEEKKC